MNTHSQEEGAQRHEHWEPPSEMAQLDHKWERPPTVKLTRARGASNQRNVPLLNVN